MGLWPEEALTLQWAGRVRPHRLTIKPPPEGHLSQFSLQIRCAQYLSAHSQADAIYSSFSNHYSKQIR